MTVQRQLVFAMVGDAINYTIGGRFGECDVQDVLTLYSEFKKCLNSEALADFEEYVKGFEAF